MKKILFTLMLSFASFAQANDFSSLIQANDYEPDIDYVVFEKPVKTITGDKVEVRELFWYYCPHCFNIEPLVNNWLKNMPSSAQFVRQPAVFSDNWTKGAVFYYVLGQLGEIDRLHEALFNAIHTEKEDFIDNEDFIEWLVENDVDKAKAENAFKSFSVRVKVNQSKLNTQKYQGLSSVPSFVVAGKYLVDAQHSGGANRMFRIINHLIKKEAKE